jgi:hypothetical protein
LMHLKKPLDILYIEYNVRNHESREIVWHVARYIAVPLRCFFQTHTHPHTLSLSISLSPSPDIQSKVSVFVLAQVELISSVPASGHWKIGCARRRSVMDMLGALFSANTSIH